MSQVPVNGSSTPSEEIIRNLDAEVKRLRVENAELRKGLASKADPKKAVPDSKPMELHRSVHEQAEDRIEEIDRVMTNKQNESLVEQLCGFRRAYIAEDEFGGELIRQFNQLRQEFLDMAALVDEERANASEVMLKEAKEDYRKKNDFLQERWQKTCEGKQSIIDDLGRELREANERIQAFVEQVAKLDNEIVDLKRDIMVLEEERRLNSNQAEQVLAETTEAIREILESNNDKSPALGIYELGAYHKTLGVVCSIAKHFANAPQVLFEIEKRLMSGDTIRFEPADIGEYSRIAVPLKAGDMAINIGASSKSIEQYESRRVASVEMDNRRIRLENTDYDIGFDWVVKATHDTRRLCDIAARLKKENETLTETIRTIRAQVSDV